MGQLGDQIGPQRLLLGGQLCGAGFVVVVVTRRAVVEFLVAEFAAIAIGRAFLAAGGSGIFRAGLRVR